MKFKSLLESYHPERTPFYFSTPEYELSVENIYEELSFARAADILQMFDDLKKSNRLRGRLAVGAIPFDVKEGGTLFLADSWIKQDAAWKQREELSQAGTRENMIFKKYHVPSPEQYMKIVELGIEDIEKGLLDKLVLSRGIEAEFRNPVDILPVLKNVYKNNPFGYTYASQCKEKGILIGASPEMLISKRGRHIYTNPLAGSRPRGKTPQEDGKLERELQHSSKDLAEHKFVVDYILNKFSAVCQNIKAPKKAEIIRTDQLLHLSSVIEGDLIDPEKTVLDAALLIHPTPAVCGVPRDAAYEKILELEGRSRNEFTGIIGWCDEYGDGDWAIAIRGAKIQNHSINIQAGAGIVKDSVPIEEMKETGVKCSTMLSAFGLDFDEGEGIWESQR